MSNNQERCSICNEELTKFGNKTLKDGVLCRNCVKLASEWLSDDDYAKRSVEDMKKHLAYREENLKKLDGFVSSRKIEGKYSVYIDDENGNFLVSKRKDLKKDNPDIVSLKNVEEIAVTQEKYLDNGGMDVFFEAKIDNDEINTIRFRVNEFPGVEADSEDFESANKTALDYLDAIAGDEFEEVKEG